jgi:hypothetical protein
MTTITYVVIVLGYYFYGGIIGDQFKVVFAEELLESAGKLDG